MAAKKTPRRTRKTFSVEWFNDESGRQRTRWVEATTPEAAARAVVVAHGLAEDNTLYVRESSPKELVFTSTSKIVRGVVKDEA